MCVQDMYFSLLVVGGGQSLATSKAKKQKMYRSFKKIDLLFIAKCITWMQNDNTIIGYHNLLFQGAQELAKNFTQTY